MFRSGPIATVLKLLVLSFAVGLVLTWLDLTPLDLLASLGESVESFLVWARGFVGWAVDYVLIGAVVVVPVWLLMLLVNRLRR